MTAATLALSSLTPLSYADENANSIASAAPGDSTAIRAFRVHVPEAPLIELRRRLRATRWPERETVPDDSQGVPLDLIQNLTRHWATDYDWRKCEAKLNALPNFVTEIDGLDIHFIHVRSKHADAMPLIVTHGWPGSILEQLKLIDPLTNPTAHGASASDAFHLVIPSLPGYGFSARTTTTGWGPERTARAWVTLMKRLGYEKFASQGGDLGGIVTNVMATQAPPELLGIHVNFPAAVPPAIQTNIALGGPVPVDLSQDERQAYDQLAVAFKKRRAYVQMMGTRPQTLYGLADSPVGLATWLLDHGDGFGQPAVTVTSAAAGRTTNGYSAEDLTMTDLLDNITLYWLTNTGVSAARFYWELAHLNYLATADISVPAAVSAFPGEVYTAPRSWVSRAYHNLIFYNRPPRGGHFAAWEVPKLLADDIRNGLRPLRT